MTAEYFSYTVSTGRTSRQDRYMHGAVIVANLTPKGEIDWVRSIPKNQVYVKVSPRIGIAAFAGPISFGFEFWLNFAKDKTVYHSYILGVGKGNLHFIYNDHPKNVELEHFRDTKALLGYKGSVPVSVTIDGNGKMTKEILMEKDRSEVVLRPKINFQDNYDHVVIYGTRKKMDKFGTIDF